PPDHTLSLHDALPIFNDAVDYKRRGVGAQQTVGHPRIQRRAAPLVGQGRFSGDAHREASRLAGDSIEVRRLLEDLNRLVNGQLCAGAARRAGSIADAHTVLTRIASLYV